jgi:hypothetical protein
MALENASPVFRPLLVDVTDSTLKWNGGREQDHWGKSNQRINKALSALGWQMLRNLKRQCDIEATIEIERSLNIQRKESVTWNLERLSVHVVPVNASHVGYPVRLKNS